MKVRVHTMVHVPVIKEVEVDDNFDFSNENNLEALSYDNVSDDDIKDNIENAEMETSIVTSQDGCEVFFEQ